MEEKKFIYVCCGAGKLTSFMAAEGIKKGLKDKGKKNFKIQHGMISDIPRYESRIDVLVCSTNYCSKHDFPIINGLPFVTQDREGQQKIIDEIAQLIED